MNVELTPHQRASVDAISDWFMPAVEGYPTVNEADPDGAVLTLVMNALDPIMPAILDVIDATADADLADYLERLESGDSEAFELLRILCVGRYLTCRPVWVALGYTGRRPVPIRPGEAQEYLEDGILSPVIARGKIYRPTPATASVDATERS